VLYAIKSNPHPGIISALAEGGITVFDVASMEEIELVANLLPGADMAYMHPVKSENSIRRAYHDFGIRTFSLDTSEELEKIKRATGGARDITLFVRVSVTGSYSAYPLAGKFGAFGSAAESLLLHARQATRQLGVCFHAGSQLMDPLALTTAMEQTGVVLRRAGVIIDLLDVGGGFPAPYPGMTPPMMENYVAAVENAFGSMPVAETCELWCEPGRALVAEAGSLIVRVDLRRDTALYINDGTYGSLFDAGVPGWVFPTRRIDLSRRKAKAPKMGFSFYGPTCDSIDYMPGPFGLPADMATGDYIEIGQLGAYALTMRTDFNGYAACGLVELADKPLMSAYGLASNTWPTATLSNCLIMEEEQ
jgi:ornithine decarboxylase